MAKKLWGGRFGKGTDPLVEEFTRSIQFDHKLARYDVIGSLVQVTVLKKAGILNADEFRKLSGALHELYDSVESSAAQDSQSEDVHTHIQNLVRKKAGDAALKLHTARSRNDQVVLAMKLYCADNIEDIVCGLIKIQAALVGQIKGHGAIVMPGFTHLQHAQPVSLGHYLDAYINMFARDGRRLSLILEHLGLTFGAGALAGTPIAAACYSVKVSDALKLKDNPLADLAIKPVRNPIDTVSDRDFVIEIISALSILAMHISRLSEDMILWATKEFDFIEIDDAYCTGSSLMPQKKNPDVLELARGNAGRLYGNLMSVLTMMKGLPLSYNRDMQLDKEPLFNSFEIVASELRVFTGLIKSLTFNESKIAEHLKDESLYATDIVYYLVAKKIAFQQAHTIVGQLIKYSLNTGVKIKDMPEARLKQFSKALVRKDIIALFDPVVAVRSKKSIQR